MKKKTSLLLLLLVLLILVACGESTSQSESASQTSENRESESEIKTIDGRALSSIEDCKKNYDDQITELKNDEKMSDYFEKAEFGKIDYI
ncbi:MAG: hypothetical protein IJM14_02370, partial [Lachnospiraceae bacterium]|nr:hypothetical protein [Lachnospiraceae bacterium]